METCGSPLAKDLLSLNVVGVSVDGVCTLRCVAPTGQTAFSSIWLPDGRGMPEHSRHRAAMFKTTSMNFGCCASCIKLRLSNHCLEELAREDVHNRHDEEDSV